MNENMEALEKLTRKLSQFPGQADLAVPVGSGNWQEYRMIKGKSKARNLLTIPGKISVAQWWNSEECDFPEHAHGEKEFLLVFEGEMHLFVEGKKYVLVAGDGRYIAPGMKHNAYFPVSTNYIASTIPDADDWPD